MPQPTATEIEAALKTLDYFRDKTKNAYIHGRYNVARNLLFEELDTLRRKKTCGDIAKSNAKQKV